MSRRKALRANPRRLLAALATILVAVGVTVASGATFTAQTANAGNTFTAGSLTMSNDKAGTAILTASGMKPGDATTDATGTVVIKNTGTLTGAFSLTRSSLTNSDTTNQLATKLNTTITDCGADQNCATAGDNSVKYTGLLSAMSSAISLGNWAGAEQHTYRFVVSLDSTADNNYQGDNAVAGFTWDAA
jgi:spore coat-associated protein N